MPKQAVLVMGARGFIGSRVLAALAESPSYRPLLLTRTPPSSPTSLEIRTCNATDVDKLTGVLRGVDFVINCIGGKPSGIAAATKALCAAARRVPPNRIVHLSSMAVYGSARGLISETAKPEPPLNGYAQAKIDSEMEMLDYVATGGDAVMIRPTCVFGPNSELWSARIARLLTARRLGDLGAAGDGVCNLVHVDDLVAVAIKCLLGPIAGETFNATADGARPSWNEFLIRFACAIGATPVKRISARQLRAEATMMAPLLRAAAIVGNRVGMAIPDAITPSLVRLCQQDITVCTAKAAQLGVRHRHWEQMVDQTAAWWGKKQD
jgi:2-alkyl-3-oxoalkanoate reductase